jgi:ABC-type phosphate/phosphonate transport system substrate-binding protein
VRLASLPWYDLPEVRWATDSFWEAVAGRLRASGVEGVPEELDRVTPFEEQWDRPGLLLSQACGYDVLYGHRSQLQVAATPAYAVPGCAPGKYRSLVAVAESARFQSLEDLRGARCVVNSATSHSGWNILRSVVGPLSAGEAFFGEVCLSGSHERSIEWIRSGQAEVAALDCVTVELLLRHRPEALAGIRFVHETAAFPAPPFVTCGGAPPQEVASLRRALRGALADPKLARARAALLLGGLRHLPLEAYEPIARIESQVSCKRLAELAACPAPV